MTNQGPTYKEKLAALRSVMAGQGVDGFIVPRADEYQGEFLAPYAERLPWLTGFTGSAGVAVILEEKAVVLTDGRYTIQIRQQVNGALYETGDSTDNPIGSWLADRCEEGDVIGFDPFLHTPSQIEAIKKALDGRDVELRPVKNLVDKVWEGQPKKPQSAVEIFPEKLAGLSAQDKRKNIAGEIEKAELDACVITLPDSLCWLLNVRGQDVNYIPLILSYAVVDRQGGMLWFIDGNRVSKEARARIGAGVEITAPEILEAGIKALKGKKIGVDFKRSPLWFKTRLEAAGAQVVDFKDPCIFPKSIKTPAEQDAIRQAHVRDGVAVVRFLHWLDKEAPKGKLTELDIADKLLEFRSADESFRGMSFPTIAGFGSNGAIVHYRATKERHSKIAPPGLLLVDSGGQYVGGTTDITRTIAVGDITDEMRDNFTRVLKGHIAIASAEVPAGSIGVDIDALARAPLKEAGLDYAHGTGHGVGCYLAVHEEAASFSPKGKDAVQPGMLISNEPGYYKEGEYGIRIESLVLVQNIGDDKIGFETVTMAPIDIRAVNKNLLSAEDVEWLNSYHLRVRKTLSPFLESEEKCWLQERTAAI